MSLLARRSEPWSPPRMDTTERDRLDRERAGEALKRLRKRNGLTQEAASAAAIGISIMTWKHYEAGRRRMDNPTLARALVAIGATAEEHVLEVAKLARDAGAAVEAASFSGMAAPHLSDRGRVMALPVGGVAHGGVVAPNLFDDGGEAEVIDFARYFTPGARVLKLAGMSMVPYAEPGGFVTYDVRQPPRRGQGCVIQMKDGSYMVKRFERIDDTQLHVTELYPTERALAFDLASVQGVYAIGLRGD